ncbi:MAG: enoyl-CoA hydratase/isomerase family protein [Bdellovibrionales bacterium]
MAHEYKTLTLKSDHAIWTLTINRPDSLNALNLQVLNEMGEALRFISEMKYEDARALIITGSGAKAFVAGADIKEMAALSSDEAVQFAKKGQSVFHELELLKIPVIAAVNGFALGGGLELALSCDFIFASDNAKLGLPEVSLGLIPGFGGTVRLSRAVGLRKARELIFSGDMITAQEALAMGLVNRVVPQAELLPTVQKRLESILSRGPIAVGRAKASIQATWDLQIDEAMVCEADHFGHLFDTEDTREGLTAFLEKRKAAFKGE